MGRNPITGFPHSNGHGRHSPGLPPVARQGNLVVEARRACPRADLEKLLIEEVKRQKRPYGMIFTDISGGFTNTSAFAPQAFKVNPVMAYRLYPDGKQELVRGIDISGTPLVALQSIRAASREIETFNGVCGAESRLGAGVGVGAEPAAREARGREGLHPAGPPAAPRPPVDPQAA